MSRHTLKHNAIFDRMATREISRVLGDPKPDEFGGKNLNWEMPYRSGVVTLHLIKGSRAFGMTTGSWLACRLNDETHLTADGYTKPRENIPGGWPGPFTHPSGKCNLHISPTDSEEEMLKDLAKHLYSISERDSAYREAFGRIEFEVPAAPKM